MTRNITSLVDEGKKNLDTLLREKAYEEVSQKLAAAGIDIDVVSDEEVEALVDARVKEMMNGIKGFAAGTVLALLISSIVGV